MFAWLGALGGIAKLLGGLLSFFQRRADQKAGAVAQAQVETQVAVVTQTAIAEAEAQAPKTQADEIASLNSGSF